MLVAHEPPAFQELPDREEALATTTAIRELFYREGFGPAMAKFIAVVSHDQNRNQKQEAADEFS